MKKFSLQDVIPAGKQIITSNQDGTLVTYITQVLSITTNLKSSSGQQLFQEPKWQMISDNFATSIGPEKARQYGSDIFLLYYDETPVLARLEGQSVMALDPNSMGARFAVTKQLLEDMYKSLPRELTSAEKDAVQSQPETPSETPKKKSPARKPSAKKPKLTEESQS